ncbi:glycosyltransferase family 2 protein [Candidatus Nitrosopumilus sp. SW]|uniref:glycosyltransferase family 2 protein n=1 Tax=Candidatus Nitrosopumilus sp. SW TaxID=2508726 RepID=UPI00115311AB|nr:glycosyltransferase family 2 protein [Candidatus Nitrosopumilus sp. SW]QDI88771.1 glycosyltransferase family 2 protein [Candidatus Nitrosopumilus sp. SW]
MQSKISKISIGLPVYNGERFLRSKLKSILNQSHRHFELIISDNGSTDNTESICKEFVQKDDRIKYFRHSQNNGITWNFNFVLEKANYEYFMWTAVDDFIFPQFIEKNLKTLEKNTNCVASICKIEPYVPKDKESQINKDDLQYSQLMKKIRNFFRPREIISITGNFNTKTRLYLKKCSCQSIYSIFKTDILRNSLVRDSFLGNDWAIFLNVLKFGDLYVNDEILMHEYEQGASGKGIIAISKQYNLGKTGIIFPWFPLTRWCLKNLGLTSFLKNFDYFLQLQIEGFVSLLIDFFHFKSNRNKLNSNMSGI